MKLLLSIVTSLTTLYSYAQSWQQIKIFPTIHILPQAVFWGDTAIMISADGNIIHSNDFFQSYIIDSTYKSSPLQTVTFPVRDIGYISAPAETGGLLLSYDGGQNWIPNSYGQYVRADWGDVAVFSSADTGYYADTKSEQYSVTYDGGLDWNDYVINVSTCQRIFQMDVIADTIRYALGNDQPLWAPYGSVRLFRSRGSDTAWREMHLFINTEGCADFKLIDDTTIFFVSDYFIEKSIDDGFTFQAVLASTYQTDIYNLPGNYISFINHDTGFVAFSASIYRTYDAGNTWQRTNFEFDNDDYANEIRFIKAVSSEKVIVGCYNGNIYKTETGGGVWADVHELGEDNNQLTLYPNPTTSQLFCTITQLTPKTYLQIYDLDGRLIQIQPVIKENTEVDVSGLSSGLYFLALQNEKGRVVKKFVKE